MNYLVIPAYQPDQKLLKLVQKLREKCDFSIIVVDDGSSEECQAIFEKLDGLATVLHHEVNLGKGGALKTAYTYIQEQGQYGTVITADADGQSIARKSEPIDSRGTRLFRQGSFAFCFWK